MQCFLKSPRQTLSNAKRVRNASIAATRPEAPHDAGGTAAQEGGEGDGERSRAGEGDRARRDGLTTRP